MTSPHPVEHSVMYSYTPDTEDTGIHITAVAVYLMALLQDISCCKMPFNFVWHQMDIVCSG